MSELTQNLKFEQLPIDEHLVLRQLQPADAPELFSVVDKSREELRKWLPWVDGTKSEADSRVFIDTMLERRAWDEEFGYAVILDGKIAGHTSLMEIRNHKAEVGYWVATEFARRGLATRATGALVDLAFSQMGLHRLTLRADERNEASQRVAEKAGFKKIGHHPARDHLGEDTTIFDYGLENPHEAKAA